MMRDKRTANRFLEPESKSPLDCLGCLKWQHGRCIAFCKLPKNCWAKVTRFEVDKYRMELEGLIERNLTNPNCLQDQRRELSELLEYIRVIRQEAIRDQDIRQAYQEDKHRGSGGGGSSEDNSNSAASLKAKMKDNRPLDCKPRKEELVEYKEELAKWEEEHGELDKHKSIGYGMSKDKIDNYTGESIKPPCYQPNSDTYELCLGNNSKKCKKCNLYQDM